MKTSRNVNLCLLILPVIVFLSKNVSKPSSSNSGIPASTGCNLMITSSGWGVTAHWMVSYSTLDGELQLTGW
jgi:hypothetical protein